MSEQNNTAAILAKLKALVKQGNVSRILIKKGDDTVLNLPLNAGIAGAAIGVAAAPWALIAGAVATIGLDCRIVVEKTNGETVEILSRSVGRKAARIGSSVLDRLASFHDDEDNV